MPRVNSRKSKSKKDARTSQAERDPVIASEDISKITPKVTPAGKAKANEADDYSDNMLDIDDLMSPSKPDSSDKPS